MHTIAENSSRSIALKEKPGGQRKASRHQPSRTGLERCACFIGAYSGSKFVGVLHRMGTELFCELFGLLVIWSGLVLGTSLLQLSCPCWAFGRCSNVTLPYPILSYPIQSPGDQASISCVYYRICFSLIESLQHPMEIGREMSKRKALACISTPVF